MPDLKKYLKNLEASGPELILEVASEDRDISDTDYAALHSAVAKKFRGPRKHIRNMADRDFARAELNKDYQ